MLNLVTSREILKGAGLGTNIIKHQSNTILRAFSNKEEVRLHLNTFVKDTHAYILGDNDVAYSVLFMSESKFYLELLLQKIVHVFVSLGIPATYIDKNWEYSDVSLFDIKKMFALGTILEANGKKSYIEDFKFINDALKSDCLLIAGCYVEKLPQDFNKGFMEVLRESFDIYFCELIDFAFDVVPLYTS